MAGRSGWLGIGGAALAGVAGIALVFGPPGSGRQDEVAFLAFAIAAGGPAAAWFLAPAARRAVLAQPVLLVPLALLSAADLLLRFLVEVPVLGPLLTAGVSLRFVHLSGHLLLASAVAVLHAGWATLMVRRAAAGLPSDPGGDLRSAIDIVPRVLALCLTGWGAVLVPVAVAATILPAVLVMPVAGIYALWWNVFTAALLVHAVDPQVRFGEALGRGTLLSWSRKREWWKPLAALLLLLGLVTVVEVSFPFGGGYRRVSNLAVHAFWAGAYENSSRWIDAWGTATESSHHSFPALLARLGIGVLAVALKFEIAAALARPAAGPAGGTVPPAGRGDVAGGAGAR